MKLLNLIKVVFHKIVGKPSKKDCEDTPHEALSLFGGSEFEGIVGE